ncbi:putative CAP-Gly domain-containing linker protein 4 [Scophthalmus maximus]|uniref:Putative CAP-Gly domain-containing linker protein 4 n=1 Tax=Scophthalmus maximus TaxID=52904 RepID=A0A2U9CM79_SCOMX|nr:putative CAP-Gly domain-containing linker protein 4 [Scophthalmus maximus]
MEINTKEDKEEDDTPGPEGVMTKEDVSEPVEGDTVLGCNTRLSSQRPVIHQVASAPMPSEYEFSFFDPNELQCREVLLDPSTTIPELFAVLRQWVPQVQKNIHLIGNEILKRGCGVNDRDGLTDMSLLHYCCKAGAPGIGDADTAASFARQLLSLGADPNLRSRWTNMRALHYAAYFDVPQLIRVVLQASQPGEVDATCSDFDFGTALHIAASNLCTSAVKCLLELGANPAFRNETGQCPADVVPDPLDMAVEMADSAAVAKELRSLLRQALPRPCSPLPLTLHAQSPPALSDKARIQLAAMGIRLGDRVVIAGQKVGTLRFCGSTEFSGGLWAGVELDKPEGKNDGSVAGVQYFTCLIKHGIFAPLSKISKPSERPKSSTTKTSTPIRPPRRIDLSRITSKINTGVRSRTPSAGSSVCEGPEVHLGERVLVVGQRTGVVQFYGKTSFAPGLWLGIELDKPSGKNDGSVGGVRYFSCPPKHGVFAPPSRVQRIHGSVDCLSELSSSRLNHPLGGPICRSLSTSLTITTPKEPSRRSSVTSSGGVPTHVAAASLPACSDGQVRLHVGMQVLLNSANEMAFIRYLGTADFAPGIWLGLELRSPKGKNDGSVGGRRYFTCRPGHGVLVRPSRVTYRGINGSHLMHENGRGISVPYCVAVLDFLRLLMKCRVVLKN